MVLVLERAVQDPQRPGYPSLRSGEHLFNQTAQTFAYLKRRIAKGELVLANAMPLDSFGRRPGKPRA